MNNSYQILIYQNTRNLGDAVQTVAFSRLLRNCYGVYRDKLATRPRTMPLVLNGYLWEKPPVDDIDTLFAGIFVEPKYPNEYAHWFANSRYKTIGARCPITVTRFGEKVPTELIGCATLTLPRYRGPRSGRYSVDFVETATVKELPGMTRLTHTLEPASNWEADWKQAVSYLDLYRRAELVYTSRLHVALPCIAMGTPVLFTPNPRHKFLERLGIFGALETAALPYGEVVSADITAWSERYRTFLRKNLNIEIAEGDITKPLALP